MDNSSFTKVVLPLPNWPFKRIIVFLPKFKFSSLNMWIIFDKRNKVVSISHMFTNFEYVSGIIDGKKFFIFLL